MDLVESGEMIDFPDDFDQDNHGRSSVPGDFNTDHLVSNGDFPGKAEMQMSYADWSVGLDSGTSWLPAYGFQQPAIIQEALMQHDGYNDGNQSYVYLETIMEETSDDLRSESDYSGWHDSDSGSVIHLPNKMASLNLSLPGDCGEGEWSGSERDLAVPKKKRRRTNDDAFLLGEDEISNRVSRSSSLVQFETLERHCEHSFSYDSLDQARWARYSDSLESSSSEENLARSFSSSSYRSGLRSSRSYDSLVTIDNSVRGGEVGLSGEFSQSLNDNSMPVLEDDPEPLPPPSSMYQTVECLDRVGSTQTKANKKVSASGNGNSSSGNVVVSGQSAVVSSATKRSSENLSEDSGFGEHIPSKASAPTGDPWSKYNTSGWQSAPDLASRAGDPAAVIAHSLLQFTTINIDDDEESLIVPENKYVMESKVPATSTPNLYRDPIGVGEAKFSDSTVSLSRALSFKRSFETEGMYATGNSRGSNIQITTSFVSLGGSPPSFTFYEEAAACSGMEEMMLRTRASGGGTRGKVVEWERPVSVSQSTAGRGYETNGQMHESNSPHAATMDSVGEKKRGLGGFFQRFSLRRLSGKDKKRKEKKKEAAAAATASNLSSNAARTHHHHHHVDDTSAIDGDLVRIIPLHGPDPSAKPPLPPRKREPPPPPPLSASTAELFPALAISTPPAAAASPAVTIPAVSVMSTRSPAGLLETDIDSDTTQTCSPGKKARSLLSLGRVVNQNGQVPVSQSPPDNRAKSMEFLLDKENHQQVKPPENELQKVGGVDRVMSEHELRVQRSLQRLNLPDWYKNCPSLPAQGFLLGKRNSDAAAHWPGLGSKTTSLSSLGSTQSAAAATTPRSPTTGHLLSPSPTPSAGGGFTRWSTSRLNSSPNSASTSPSGSARSSFNYRQPYLGWRSQERIARPRTPAERLAAGLLPLKQQHQNVPNLSEVHTSIKEVTSAIANYVSKGDDRLSPAPHRHDHTSSRSASPRGSKNQLCWLESSFVGCKPLEVPETPLTATPPRAVDLRLDLTPATATGTNMKTVNNDAFQ